MRYLALRPETFLDNIENDFDSMLSGTFFDRFMDKGNKKLFMPIDLKEFDNSYEVKAELPGIKKEDIDLDITKNHIRITARKEENKEEKNKKFYKSEFKYGTTSRTVYFPEEIKLDEAKAKMDGGILKIELPKAKPSEAKEQKLNIE